MAEIGIIARVFGKRTKAPATPAEALAAAEAAVARHAEELRAASEEIAAALRDRSALLVRDGTDEQIAAIEQRVAAARLRVERLEMLREPLAAKIADARDSVRAAKWAELSARYAPEADAWLAAAREVRRAVASMTAIRGEAINAGCQAEATSFMPPAAVQLSDEAIAEFARAIRRAREVAEGKPAASKAEKPSATVRVRWKRDPSAPTIGPSGRFNPQRQGFAGAVSALSPDEAAAAVVRGDAELVDKPAPAPDDRAAWAANTMTLAERAAAAAVESGE